MSVISVSYAKLSGAEREARNVANRLNNYANSLEWHIYNKLNGYSGEHSENIEYARRNTFNKIIQLQEKADIYNRYASGINEICECCERTDKAVKLNISRLTAAFKESHGIKTGKVRTSIERILVKSGNRYHWISDAEYGAHNIKTALDTWWNYEGGKQKVIGISVAVIKIAAGVCAVVVAVLGVLSGGLTLVIIAKVVVGLITTLNAVVNLQNELRAREVYNDSNNYDPATARRLSDEDTIQDTIRAEAGSDIKKWYGIAGAIDTVNTVCTVVMIADSVLSFLNDFLKVGLPSVNNIDKGTIFKEGLQNHFWDFGSIKDSFSSFKNIIGTVESCLKIVDGDLKGIGELMGDIFTSAFYHEDENLDESFDLNDGYGIYTKGVKIYKGFSDINIMIDKFNQISDLNVSVPQIDNIKIHDVNTTYSYAY